MDSLAREIPIDGVPDLKRRYQIPRSTFYRYYANLDDLKVNFLDNYYELLVDKCERSIRSYDDLSAHYVRLWQAMKRQESFFEAVLKTAKFPDLRLRWLGVVEKNTRRFFPKRGTTDDVDLWDLHMEFARVICGR